MYLLCKLRFLDVSRELLPIVYKNLVESVFTFNIVVWYENLGVKRNAKVARIVGMAGKTTGAKQDSPSDLYLTAVEQKTARLSVTPIGLTIQSADCQGECVQRIFYPKRYFCFKFSGYLTCSRYGFQGSALLTL